MEAEKSKKLQSFEFFKAEVIAEKPVGSDVTLPTFNDIAIDSAVYIAPRLYLASTKKKSIFIHENESIFAQFQPFNERLEFVQQVSMSPHGVVQNFLVVYGTDSEQPNDVKRSYIKFYEHDALMLNDFKNIKPRKVIPVGKPNYPIKNPECFGISRDLTAMGFGLADGTVILFRSKNLINSEWKESLLNVDKTAIAHCLFTTDTGGNTHMFCVSRNVLYCYANCSQKMELFKSGFRHCDVDENGDLICIGEDGQTIYSFSPIGRKEKEVWNFEGDKMEMKTYGKSYIACIVNNKKESTTTSQSFNIYDLKNRYLAFSKSYPSVLNVITGANNIFIIVATSRNQNSLIKLTENDASDKIRIFTSRSSYEYAITFAQNQGYDGALLAEIHRCHANHLYDTKKDYANAIKEYMKTVGYVEPSYVIMRFLDVSQIDYLIAYLEHLHAQKLGDKHHTALLLNCFVKQKNIDKLKEFLLEKKTLDSDLFDTETAIKTCRENENTDLALELAERTNHHVLYLRILVEDKKGFAQAIDHMRFKLPLEDKIRYFREYGQALLKGEPDRTLEYMKKLVTLSTFKKNKYDKDRQLTTEEREVIKYFNIPETDYPKISEITYPKPDEFFHFFVVQTDEKLEDFLKFLRNCKNIPNEKAVFHKVFEYYLEKYHTFFVQNEKVLQHRMTADENLMKWKQIIMSLLQEPQYESKYDKNHILVLFKMFNFEPGIIYLCDKMQLREELLQYYCEAKDDNGIINLCKKYGETEVNLWVQALKYFAKAENNKTDKIPEILDLVEKIDVLSPLLVLNILSREGKVKLKAFKKYYSSKMKALVTQIDKDTMMMKASTEKIERGREEYRKLKTAGKIFQTKKCSHCDKAIYLPSVNFMCGHSFHENCLDTKDKSHYECPKCCDEHKNVLDSKEMLEKKSNDFRVFYARMQESKDGFDVVADFLGKGLFKPIPPTFNDY